MHRFHAAWQRFTIFAFLTLAGASLGEFNETVAYPEKDPLFTVEVPKGWQIKHEDGAIRLSAPQSAIFLVQQVSSNVKDAETAKEAVLPLADAQGKNFDLKNAQISTHVRDFEVGEYKGLLTDGQGTDSAGYETLWQVVIFSPIEGKYFLLTSMWTKGDTEPTEADRRALFNSVKSR